MPTWANETVRQRIKKLFDIGSYLLFGSELLVRLRSGKLLKFKFFIVHK